MGLWASLHVFFCENHRVLWQGVADLISPQLHFCINSKLLEILLLKFTTLFDDLTSLLLQHPCNQQILLPSSTPAEGHPYYYPTLHKNDLEHQRHIHLSMLLFSLSVLFVMKLGNSWCFYVDYRTLNVHIMNDIFSILVVDELFNELLDLHSNYHQVRMHPKNVSKTTFLTHEGYYEFMVMLFGFCSASVMFQVPMNDVLQSLLHLFVLAFFDEILILSTSQNAHLNHLQSVLQVLLR